MLPADEFIAGIDLESLVTGKWIDGKIVLDKPTRKLGGNKDRECIMKMLFRVRNNEN